MDLVAMQDWRAIVGVNIRRRRLELGFTQEQVALEAEIDLTYMGGIERGRRNPSLLVLVRVAAVLRIPPGELLAPL
ncbi:UNVERIFIED_ORG: transcriptional regulator with XRE-family HTH domain [Sphingomonas sp. R1F5B]